jgi:hypothetical protein
LDRLSAQVRRRHEPFPGGQSRQDRDDPFVTLGRQAGSPAGR